MVTAAPELLPSTMNCTLVVFADTFVAMEMVPETVVPETGEMMETVGADFLAWGVSELAVTPAQPLQSSVSAKTKCKYETAPGCAADLPTSPWRRLKEFPVFLGTAELPVLILPAK